MKIYTVEFNGMWPVPHGLVIAANSIDEAFAIASETVKHETITIDDVHEYTGEAGVVFYESGDY